MTSHTVPTFSIGRLSRALGRPAVVAFASTLVGLTAASAHAHDALTITDDVPSVAVNYADLNLATEEGTEVLYKRIVAAATRVCAENTGPGLAFVMLTRRCVNNAVTRAVNDIDSPKLAELQAARMHRVDRG